MDSGSDTRENSPAREEDEDQEFLPGDDEHEEEQEEIEQDVFNAAEAAQWAQEAKQIADEHKEVQLQENENPDHNIVPPAEKKRRTRRVHGLFTQNEAGTVQHCNFCPKTYKGGPNTKKHRDQLNH